jgi:Domain of unknown function (DUF4145)
MDGYGLIASLVQSVAWPSAIVFGVWMFRRRLTELLPMLRVRHKDWEASFRLDKAEQEAARLPAPISAPETRPTAEEKSGFEQIADISPQAAILERRREIEEAVYNFARNHEVEITKGSLLAAIRILRSKELIDADTSALLDDLRTVGNAALHSDDNTTFTKDDALRFGALADRVVGRLELLSSPGNFNLGGSS